MNDQAAVLFANEAFYAAFLGRDPETMDALWSRRETVTCIHPGWGPLAGREAVMESWQSILTAPHAPRITCHDPSAHVFGDLAYVICYENIPAGWLVATNVFVREDGTWKLVHHQAGACPPVAPEQQPAMPMQ